MSDDDQTGTDGQNEQLTAQLSHTSKEYKVLGETDAIDGVGVLGHNTATTGASHGVEGVTDSGQYDASGVRGKAVGGGLGTYGVRGTSDSPEGVGVQGKATATTGTPIGVKGLNYSTDSDAIGIFGKVVYQTDKRNTGIKGATQSSRGTGVHGNASAGSGETTGVLGEVFSGTNGATGVVGWANSSDGRTYGVQGTTESADTGAAGVQGSTGYSGQVYGVQGETFSPDNEAAGVRGDAANGSGANGVAGVTYNTKSNVPSVPEPTGVVGAAEQGGAFGVVGWSKQFEGVVGRSDGSSQAALVGFNPAGGFGLSVRGGPVEKTSPSAAVVYPGSGSAQTINSASTTVVDFDSVQQDGQEEFSTSNNEFTLDKSGTYRVDANVLWRSPTSGTEIRTQIHVNGSEQAQNYYFAGGGRESTSVTKVLPNLSAGDTIDIRVYHDEGSTLELDDDYDDTYASFVRVG